MKEEIRWSMKQIDGFGFTKKKKGGKFIKIELNQGLATQSREVIEDTIYHELAHAVVGVKGGHGKKWKEVIGIVREQTGLPLHIKGRIDEVTDEFWFTGHKYVLKCKKCGKIIGINTKNDLVKHPEEWDAIRNRPRFSHTRCGGQWERIK